MLTRKEREKLEIVAYSIQNPKSNQDDIAAHFAKHKSIVNRAIKWGERSGLYLGDAQDKLRGYITEARKHQQWLESEIKLLKESRRKVESSLSSDTERAAAIRVYSPGLITGLSRELRETRQQLLELEGLLQKTVTIQHLHNGSIKHDISLPPAISAAIAKILQPTLDIGDEPRGSDDNS